MATDPRDCEETRPAPLDAPPLSWRRLRWAWRLFRAWRAEGAGEFDRALRLLDSAAGIGPLRAEDRVRRAWLLLRAQRLRESQTAFAALRKQFEGSEDPDLRYLRHFCTAMLGMLRTDSAPMAYAARQARSIPCRPGLRRDFPLVGDEEEGT